MHESLYTNKFFVLISSRVRGFLDQSHP